ncbi:MAG: ribokinase [Clostridia bacterium]
MQPVELVILGLCGQSVFLTVPHLHVPEETLHATEMFAEPGGKGYNQATAAARLGGCVGFAGAVGEDEYGALCQKRLLLEGVAKVRLFPKQGEHTAYASILTDQMGENRVTVYPGASKRLTAEDVEELGEWFAQAKLVLLTPEIPQVAFERAMTLALHAGVRVVINPAPYKPWVNEYLKDAWCITPNRHEAEAMLGLLPEEDVMAAALASDYGRMVITLGAQGAWWMQGGMGRLVPAPQVTAVDTTGAGDALNAALCVGLLQGKSLEDATRYAVLAAALSVTRAHVLDALPYADQIH